MNKVATNKVIMAYIKKAQYSEGFEPKAAQDIQEGRSLVDKVDENSTAGKKPFEGLSMEDKRKIMAYVVLKRENPVLESEDNINYEAAVNALKEEVYDNEKELEQKIVEQASRLGAFFKKTLEVDSNGKIKVKEQDGDK